MKHADIWRAIDALAVEKGLSTSGLAKLAGLDPTTFNLSRRSSQDGRSRWPSTESIAKLLEATGASIDMFSSLISGTRAFVSSGDDPRRVPLIAIADAGAPDCFDDRGCPVGTKWNHFVFHDLTDPYAYALQIDGGSMEPVFRDRDTIVVSPNTPCRPGDRVVVRTTKGGISVNLLAARSPAAIKLQSLDLTNRNSSVSSAQLVSLHRIIWVSQ